MSDACDRLLASYKTNVKTEIENLKTARPPVPSSFEDIPAAVEADELAQIQWEAATRDSIPLYDEENIYERHVDALTLSDAKEAAAFYYLLARAKMEAGDQHFFAGDVLADINKLESNDA